MRETIKVGILKIGCVGTLPILEFLLDERAERTDIDVSVIGSGAKVGTKQCQHATNLMIGEKPDLVVLVGPAQTTNGPTEARKMLRASGIPLIVVSDSPAKKIAKEMEEAGQGYIIIEADSMIGARREFLDPSEMASYNSDVMKVLAFTGTFSLVVQTIDSLVASIRIGKKLELPRLVVDAEAATKAAGFTNPYSKSKAIAAYELARGVARITTRACFRVQNWKVYIPLVAAAHEMMRAAARLADEARELEMAGDKVMRKPHFNDGMLGEKRNLIEKPRRKE